MSALPAPTSRLTIRAWQQEDRPLFARMNADPAVMEFLPHVLSRQESDAMVDRFVDEHNTRGFCPWAVEETASGSFIGFVGLHEVSDSLPFSPAVEVGWRLGRPFWGCGYATEAASSSLSHGFGVLGITDVVSMTSVMNGRSRAVMERLGMHTEPGEDFEHPRLALGHHLRPHVLYRLSASEWDRNARRRA